MLQKSEPGQFQADEASDEASPLPGWRRPFLIGAIFSGFVACSLLYDALPPILAPLARHFGGGQRGELIAQLASTVPLFGVMVSGLVAGLLIERQGLRGALFAALVVFALTGSAGLVIDDPWLLLGTRWVMGFANGVMQACCTSLIALYYTGVARARMNGLLITVGSASGFIFVLIAGQMAAHFSWRGPFALHGLVAAVFAFPILLMGPARRVTATGHGAWANLKRLRPVLPAYVLCVAIYILLVMFNVQLAFVLAASGFSAPVVVANVFALVAGSIMVVSFFYDKIAARFAMGPTLTLVFLGAAATLVLTGSASALPMFVCAVLMNGLTMGVGLPALWTYAMRLSPPDLVPRALGLVATSYYLGGTLSPMVTAPLRAAAGLRGQFFVVAGVVVVAVLLVHLRRRRLQWVAARAPIG
jgi:MFS family permease